MKTRIKILTKRNGNKTYIPQVKYWFFWKDYTENNVFYNVRFQYTLLENCQKKIDEILETKYKGKQNKVVDTTYVDYP